MSKLTKYCHLCSAGLMCASGVDMRATECLRCGERYVHMHGERLVRVTGIHHRRYSSCRLHETAARIAACSDCAAEIAAKETKLQLEEAAAQLKAFSKEMMKSRPRLRW